jgi:pimeloyl-ACP methyl ester carboxylesterase
VPLLEHDEAGAAPLSWSRCAVPGDTASARCADVLVPEDRGAARSRSIPIHVLVLPARTASPAAEPLVFLAGGPGQAATSLASFAARVFASVRERRDIVLVDVRGTGGSHPLDAALPDSLLFDRLDAYVPPRWARAARATAGDSTDFRLYTTSAIVEDLDDVRRALGSERIHLYATSYGTRVALEYLRRHGDRVRTATLKNVVPPDVGVGQRYGETAQRSFDLLCARCAADSACRSLVPDPATALRTALASLERAPRAIALTAGPGAPAVQTTLTRDALALLVRTLLYGQSTRAQLPALVAAAAAGRDEVLAPLLARSRTGFAAALYEGMALSVLAAEDLRFLTPHAIAVDSAGTFLRGAVAHDLLEILPDWPRGPSLDTTAVVSDVPVLLLSGGADPATPPAFADRVARTLRHSLHVVLPEAAHAADGFEECMATLVPALLERGDVAGLDTSCVARAPRQVFAIPPSPSGGRSR